MSSPLHASLDASVLDLIERSPTGSVPHTPAYSDALARLQAARQIYPSADHREGYVTARALATLPVFAAANLDEAGSGRIPPEALEPNARVFDRYVQSLPESLRSRAETFRLRVAGKPIHHRHKASDGTAIHDPVHTLFLLPGAGPNRGLPGNYLHGTILEAGPADWSVVVHDCDDGAATGTAASLAAAVAQVRELEGSVPFHLEELASFGFRML